MKGNVITPRNKSGGRKKRKGGGREGDASRFFYLSVVLLVINGVGGCRRSQSVSLLPSFPPSDFC